jgi:hypothetical protein
MCLGKKDCRSWIGVASLFGVLVVCSAGAPVAIGAVIYVNENQVGGGNDGSSWDDAYSGAFGVQSAILSSSAGDQIWVAAGRYIPAPAGNRFGNFSLRNGVAIFGGFAGDETSADQRDPEVNETILSGDLMDNDNGNLNLNDNSYNVVSGNFTNATAVLDGFTITGGNANHSSNMLLQVGGGMICRDGSSPSIRRCRFTGNRVTFGGGAIYFRSSSPIITDCVFEDNNGGAFGGAFDMFNNCSPILTRCVFRNNVARRAGGVEVFGNCSPTFNDCVFENNTATSNPGIGGGMYVTNGGLTRLNRCVFVGNRALNGGGMYIQGISPIIMNTVFVDNGTNGVAGQGGAILNTSGSNPQLENCLLANNFAGSGGGLQNLVGANPRLTNCTVVNNSATNVGGGMANLNNAPIVRSSIVWANTDSSGSGVDAQIREIGAAATNVTFSIVQGGFAGMGNSGDDPMFLGVDDYRLSSASPGIDAGDPTFVPLPTATDLDGHSRVFCAEIDMGAYEYGIGDGDCDLDIDLVDFGAYLDCVSGPGGGVDAGCDAYDADADGDVDWADIYLIQPTFTLP